MNKIRLVVASLLLGAATGFAQKPFNASGTGNPIIPGYFADPTVKKFGDTYYMYATTDGGGAGFGPAQVWTSKDFVNWTLMPMNWPDSHWIWAPDVMKHTDGNYYYFYCQPCMIHCGVSETPRGPWKNILGESEAVLVPDRFVTNAITHWTGRPLWMMMVLYICIGGLGEFIKVSVAEPENWLPI